MGLLIKNGNVLVDGKVVSADILIEGEKISSLGRDLSDGIDVIDVSGLMVIPGCIDAHVHFRDFGQEDKEDWHTASMAALKGGITTVLDMPNNKLPINSIERWNDKRKAVFLRSYVNFRLYMMVTDSNVDEINGNDDIKAVKLYLGKTTGDNSVFDPELIFKRLRKDIIIFVHAEDNDVMDLNEKKLAVNDDVRYHSIIRDSKAESVAVRKLLDLAKKYGNPLHVAHVSCSESVRLIRDAKKDGLDVTCETCPHYLFLDTNDYDVLGNFCKMNPALKSTCDRKALLDGIKDGTIDMVNTDHAPHTYAEKKKKYPYAPSGVPGVETMLPLLLDCVNSNVLSLKRLVEITSLNQAKRFGIRNKARIVEGFDADLSIVDMGLVKEVRNEDLLTKCGWSPFDSRKLKGWPVMTIINGKVAYDGKIHLDIKGKEI